MINKDGGGGTIFGFYGGGTIFGFYGGDTAVMRGDIELMGGPPSPPTRENPASMIQCNVHYFAVTALERGLELCYVMLCYVRVCWFRK